MIRDRGGLFTVSHKLNENTRTAIGELEGILSVIASEELGKTFLFPEGLSTSFRNMVYTKVKLLKEAGAFPLAAGEYAVRHGISSMELDNDSSHVFYSRYVHAERHSTGGGVLRLGLMDGNKIRCYAEIDYRRKEVLFDTNFINYGDREMAKDLVVVSSIMYAGRHII